MASVVHEKWAFQPLPMKQFASLEDSVVKELLMKWYEQRSVCLSIVHSYWAASSYEIRVVCWEC